VEELIETVARCQRQTHPGSITRGAGRKAGHGAGAGPHVCGVLDDHGTGQEAACARPAPASARPFWNPKAFRSSVLRLFGSSGDRGTTEPPNDRTVERI